MSASSFAIDRRHLLLTGGAALLLASCANTGRGTQIYLLKPEPPAATGGARVSWKLAIASPYAPESLNIERIALSRTAATLDYFADSTWTDRLPVVLQNALVETFEKSGRIQGVSRETAGLNADYVLETEIRDFAAHYEGGGEAPEAQVRIAAKLVKLPDRDIVGTMDSSQRAPASENTVAAVVSAFNVALTASLREILDWTLAAPAAAKPPAAAPARRRRRRRRARA
jgi:cholesterol transport system auxiliary component